MALTNTITHAKFNAMRMKLGIPAAWLLGHLEMYWQYCHTHGHTMPYEHVEFAAGWSEAFPDRYDEFITAALEWGWIDCNDDGTVSAHDYMNNAPRFVKNREQTRERMANIRKQKQTPQTKANTNQKKTVKKEPEMFDNVCNGLQEFDDVTQCLTIDVDIEVDVDKEHKTLGCVESLGVDIKSNPKTYVPDLPAAKPARARKSDSSSSTPAFSTGFLAAWKAYPHYCGRSSKAKAWDKWRAMRLDSVAGLPELILAWVEHLKTSVDWQKQDGQFVPAMQVWLGNRIWTNGEPPAAEKKELACEWEVE